MLAINHQNKERPFSRAQSEESYSGQTSGHDDLGSFLQSTLLVEHKSDNDAKLEMLWTFGWATLLLMGHKNDSSPFIDVGYSDKQHALITISTDIIYGLWFLEKASNFSVSGKSKDSMKRWWWKDIKSFVSLKNVLQVVTWVPAQFGKNNHRWKYLNLRSIKLCNEKESSMFYIIAHYYKCLLENSLGKIWSRATRWSNVSNGQWSVTPDPHSPGKHCFQLRCMSNSTSPCDQLPKPVNQPHCVKSLGLSCFRKDLRKKVW